MSGDDRPGETPPVEETLETLEPGEKADILTSLYAQLDSNHHHHNTIIFQVYNLSVVFFGSIGSVLLTSNLTEQLTAGIALFGAFVMFMLWFWAYMYLQGRRQIKERKENIVRELQAFDAEFSHSMDGVGDAFFFKHDETAKRSAVGSVAEKKRGEQPEGDFLNLEQRKDMFQWAYFLVLGVIFLGVAVSLLI
jgi:hypothetical protein